MNTRNLVTLLVILSLALTGGALLYSSQAQKQNSGGTPTPAQGQVDGRPPGPHNAGPADSPQAPPETAPVGDAGAQHASAGPGSRRNQIEQEYISRLQSLASGYEGEINRLVAAAQDEYKAAQKARPGTDASPLASKYFAAAKALEAECDTQFYSLLAQFESELRANDLPLDAAVKAKETYEARKSTRARQITSGKP